MSDHTLTLNLDNLAVERIEVVPASSLDSAAYGHGMRELAASCGAVLCSCGDFRPEMESDVV